MYGYSNVKDSKMGVLWILWGINPAIATKKTPNDRSAAAGPIRAERYLLSFVV
jgi:hypothetical protein